jgi:hypothetical protein
VRFARCAKPYRAERIGTDVEFDQFGVDHVQRRQQIAGVEPDRMRERRSPLAEVTGAVIGVAKRVNTSVIAPTPIA